jgi:hypothetical protein
MNIGLQCHSFESQKENLSIISQAVRELNVNYRLILTGTPLENSTFDLWSQIVYQSDMLLTVLKKIISIQSRKTGRRLLFVRQDKTVYAAATKSAWQRSFPVENIFYPI